MRKFLIALPLIVAAPLMAQQDAAPQLPGVADAARVAAGTYVVDSRHTQVELLSYEEIGERSFAGWSMGQVDMARLNPALMLKYSECATLDPYAVSGAVSMALFRELVATASIVGQS